MKQLFLLSVLLVAGWAVQGQNGAKKIAVANPNVQGLHATPEIAAKLLRLELFKLNLYSVYDEFDMADVIKNNPQYQTECYGINCLTAMGKDLNVDYIVSGSFDGLGNKIAISIKIIDVKNQTIYKSGIQEFNNIEMEMQRMVEVMLKNMHQLPYDEVTANRLAFSNEPITANTVGRINNNGPRIGYALMTGTLNEFATRPSQQGGLDIFPGVSMIGYQLEGQYVGTENFSALIEALIFFTGMEQGEFIPSLTILNGFRFGKKGYEFAFGPGIGIKRVSSGFFDTENLFGEGANAYFSERDWSESGYNFDAVNEIYLEPGFYNSDYVFEEHLDKRGDVVFNTTWVFAVGRTFRSGALNIPVNIFYSSHQKGGMAGVSVGFNVLKSKETIQ